MGLRLSRRMGPLPRPAPPPTQPAAPGQSEQGFVPPPASTEQRCVAFAEQLIMASVRRQTPCWLRSGSGWVNVPGSLVLGPPWGTGAVLGQPCAAGARAAHCGTPRGASHSPGPCSSSRDFEESARGKPAVMQELQVGECWAAAEGQAGSGHVCPARH